MRTAVSRTQISLGVLAMLASLHVQAQQNPVPPDASAATPVAPVNAPDAPTALATGDKPNDSVVLVTGFRASLNSALNTKKNSDGIVDVIKAEDIAKFPDANLAESLQRVPGVALARGDGGEGKQITV